MLLKEKPGRITGIAATNFEGGSFNYPISPVTVVCGRNFSGKTTVLNAIRIGLYGYHIAVGKQPGSTWKFAGLGKEMTIKLTCENTVINHRWSRNAKGVVTFKNGLEFEVPNVLLDAHEYLDGTAEERTKTVFKLCDLSSFSSAGVLDSISAIEVIPTKLSQPIVNKLVEGLAAIPHDGNVADWLNTILEHCKAKQRDLSVLAKHHSSNTSAFTPKLIVGPAPHNVAPELAAARQALQDVQSKIAVAAQVASQQTRAKEIQAILDALPDFDAEIIALEADSAMWAPTPCDLDGVEGEAALSNASLNGVQARVTELKRIDAQLSAKYTEAFMQTACPYCGADRPGWETKLKATINSDRAKNNSLLGEANAELRKVIAQHQAIETRLKAARTLDAQNKDCAKKLTEISTRVQALKDDKLKAGMLREELARISTTAPAEDTADLQAKLPPYSAAVAYLEEQQKAYDAVVHDRTRAGDEEAKLITMNISVEVYKLAVKTIVSALEAEVAKAFNSLLAKTRVFTDGILETPLEYRDGELGRVRDGAWVSHETLSGAERAVAYVSLSIALAQNSPIKVVMFDELSSGFDPKMKKIVVAKMLELTANGTIDNCIFADPDAEFWQIKPGVNETRISVINLNDPSRA